MNAINPFEFIYIITAFLFQAVLITHFMLRKWRFDQAIYYGWITYALSIPAGLVSILLIVDHEPWYLWVSGLLYLLWAIYGYWIEYVKGIQWRIPIRWSVLVIYISLYLATVMFYWWPLAQIHKPLWYIYSLLFIASTVLNVISHKRGETTARDAKKYTYIQHLHTGETK